jgi:hypothetical protein
MTYSAWPTDSAEEISSNRDFLRLKGPVKQSPQNLWSDGMKSIRIETAQRPRRCSLRQQHKLYTPAPLNDIYTSSVRARIKMEALGDELRRFGEENPDVMHIIEIYKEIDRTYRETLAAMGIINEPVLKDGSTSGPSVSFRPSSSTSSD